MAEDTVEFTYVLIMMWTRHQQLDIPGPDAIQRAILAKIEENIREIRLY